MQSLGAVINDDTYDRKASWTEGYGYQSDVKDGGVSGELNYDFGGAELTSISAYRYNKWTRGTDADYNNLDILHRAAGRRLVQPLLDLYPGIPAQRQCRLRRLAGRRLFRQRGSQGPRQSRIWRRL